MRTTATTTECRNCTAPTISALADDAREAVCDLAPLTRAGELLAALDGRTVYRLDRDRKLWRTDRWRIGADSPLPGDHRLASHVCGRPVPADWIQPPDQARPRPDEDPAW